jgi:hypothetical protein
MKWLPILLILLSSCSPQPPTRGAVKVPTISTVQVTPTPTEIIDRPESTPIPGASTELKRELNILLEQGIRSKLEDRLVIYEKCRKELGETICDKIRKHTELMNKPELIKILNAIQ